MTSFLNKLAQLLTAKTRAKIEEEYLSQAYNLVDLERRQRLVQYKNMKEWI